MDCVLLFLNVSRQIGAWVKRYLMIVKLKCSFLFLLYFTSFSTTFSQNYTSCCKSRPTVEYIHSWVKCSGLCITFSQCQSPDWGLGQTLSNDCQIKMFISFSRVYNFYITFWKIRNAFLKLLLGFKCVRGSKKILTVKRYGDFSNRIVNIRSVNRKFGYTSHP